MTPGRSRITPRFLFLPTIKDASSLEGPTCMYLYKTVRSFKHYFQLPQSWLWSLCSVVFRCVLLCSVAVDAATYDETGLVNRSRHCKKIIRKTNCFVATQRVRKHKLDISWIGGYVYMGSLIACKKKKVEKKRHKKETWIGKDDMGNVMHDYKDASLNDGEIVLHFQLA